MLTRHDNAYTRAVTEPAGASTNDQRAALLGLLAEIPAEDWARPTACRGWPVRDVVAHLVEGELLFGRIYRGELRALTREDADAEAGVARWSHADSDTLRFSLWHHGTATQRVIDSRSGASWDRELPIFEEPGRLGDVLGIHFFDLALHSHDVSNALGAASLWGDRVAAIASYCVSRAPVLLDRAAIAEPDGLTVEVEGAGSWTLARTDGAWRIVPDEASGRWITDATTLVEATAGRILPGEAVERSKVEGDPGAIEQLIAAWRLKSG